MYRFVLVLFLSISCVCGAARQAFCQQNAFPLRVGEKWVYDYDYRETRQCRLASPSSYDEEGTVYLEVKAKETSAGQDVYRVRETVKSEAGVVSCADIRLLKDDEGLKDAATGKILLNYQESSWSDYSFLFADAGTDNSCLLSGPVAVTVPAGAYSACKVAMTDRDESSVSFPAPRAVERASSEHYADQVGLVKSEWTETITDQAPPVCESIYRTTIELRKAVPAGQDVYEADDVSTRASLLTVAGETQSHTFHSASDVDYVRFIVDAGAGYFLETSNLQAGADTVLTLYATDGSTVVATGDDSGGRGSSRIQYAFASAGTYYAAVREKRSAAGGGYDLSIRKASTALYFPHVASGAGWWTGIACLNPGTAQATLTLTGYRNDGGPLSNALSFPGGECRDLEVRGEPVANCPFLGVGGKALGLASDYFYEDETDDLAWARVTSDQGVTGFALTGTTALDRLIGVPASRGGNLTLYFPHVVSDSDWSSTLVLVNVSERAATVSVQGFEDSGAEARMRVPVTLEPGEKYSKTVVEIFGSSAGAVGYLKAVSDEEIAGLVILSHKSTTQMVGEPAFADGSTTLYLPHIPVDPLWDSQVALANIGSGPASITVTAFGSTGSALASNRLSLAAGARYFGGPGGLVGGTLPSGSAYLQVSANQKLIGYDLFRTTDNRVITGVKAAATGLRTFYFSHVAANSTWWTGLVLVNRAARSASVTMTAYDQNGTSLGTAQNFTAIGGGAKKVDVVENFFSDGSLPTGTAWLKVEASQLLVGFELFGTKNFSQLAGFSVTE